LDRNPLLREKYAKEFKQYEQTTESDFKSKRGSKSDGSQENEDQFHTG
jgi:hypothetical protein